MKLPGSSSRLTAWAWGWSCVEAVAVFAPAVLGRGGGRDQARRLGRGAEARHQLAPVGRAAHGTARAGVVARKVPVFVLVRGLRWRLGPAGIGRGRQPGGAQGAAQEEIPAARLG